MEGVGSVTDKIIRFLVTHAHCTECGSHYRAEDVYVLVRSGRHIWDLAAVCHQCYTLSVVRAVVRPHRGDGDPTSDGEGLLATGSDVPDARLSEFTSEELLRFRTLGPIDADDVLDVSRFLESFDGDFHALFAEERDAP
jgi:hypothetical protein